MSRVVVAVLLVACACASSPPPPATARPEMRVAVTVDDLPRHGPEDRLALHRALLDAPGPAPAAAGVWLRQLGTRPARAPGRARSVGGRGALQDPVYQREPDPPRSWRADLPLQMIRSRQLQGFLFTASPAPLLERLCRDASDLTDRPDP